MGKERKKEIKDFSKVYGQATGRTELPSTELRRAEGGAGRQSVLISSVWGVLRFLRHLNGPAE